MPRNTQRNKRRWVVAGAFVLVLVMAAPAAVWQWTPLHDAAGPRVIAP
jgi:hypothetical protein